MRFSDQLHNLFEPRLRPRLPTPDHPEQQCIVCAGPTLSFGVFADGPAVLQCPTCGTETLSPLPTAREIAEYYDHYPTTVAAEEMLPALIDLNRQCLERGLASVGRGSEGLGEQQFLEIGFGNGTGLVAAGLMGAKVSGVEIDDDGIRRAKALADARGVELDITKGFVADLRENGTVYDFVKASHVIEHTLNPRAFLSDIAAIQPKGGVLTVECPNNKALLWLVKNSVRKSFGREMFYNSLKETEHLWGFTQDSLAVLVTDAGYRVVECRDYPVGAGNFQPDTALWYPDWLAALKACLRERSWVPAMYAGVRSFDAVASKLLAAGTCLALVAVRT